MKRGKVDVKNTYLLNLMTVFMFLFSGYAGAGIAEDSVLIKNCENGDIQEVINAIQGGGNINARDKDGETPLMAAVNFGHTEIVKLLTEKGADVNAKAIDGTTALMVASMGARPVKLEIIEILVLKGADVNTKNNRGMTALMIASYYNLVEVAKFLIDNGADVNARGSGDYMTPLGYAMHNVMSRESPEMIKMLKNAGAVVEK